MKIVTCRATPSLIAVLALVPIGQERIRVDTTVVSVNVLVRSSGSVVKNLSASDFRVHDNGVVQRVDVVAVDGTPVDFTVVLDVSGSTLDRQTTYWTDASVLTALLRPGDRVRLVTCGTTVNETVALQPVRGRLPLTRVPAGGATSLNDGLVAVLAARTEAERRGVIVAFTDGIDTMSVLTAEKVLEVARRSDSLLQLVVSEPVPTTVRSGFRGDPVRAPSPMANSPRTPVGFQGYSLNGDLATLVRAAEATGGGRMSLGALGGSPVRAVERILHEFRSGYILRYEPTGVPRGGWHEVKVEIARPGQFEVRARRGYFGG
jgi:VWFA-related protein